MIRQWIGRWTLVLSALMAASIFFSVLTLAQASLGNALYAAINSGIVPLYYGGLLLFSPSDAVNSPLRYLGARRPTIIHTNEPEKPDIIRKPRKKASWLVLLSKLRRNLFPAIYLRRQR